jgi:hypothetical protein
MATSTNNAEGRHLSTLVCHYSVQAQKSGNIKKKMHSPYAIIITALKI